MNRRMLTDDRGDASIMLVVVMVALIAMLGLVVDVGGRLRAGDEAAYVARQAARAAGQQIETSQAQNGGAWPDVTNSGAQGAAHDVLAAAGMTGSVNVSGQTVTVTATTSYTPRLLGVIGAGTWDVTSTASARVARGITEEG